MESTTVDLLEKDLTYYEVLNLEKDATMQEIKRAYRKLAVMYHPDKHINSSEKESLHAEKVMTRVNKIYSILMDEERRKEYDEKGEVNNKESRYATKENSPIFDELFRSVEIPMETPYTVLVMESLKVSEVIKGCTKKIIVTDEELGNGEGIQITVDIPGGTTDGTILTYYNAVKFPGRVLKSNVSIAIRIKQSKKLQLDGNNVIVTGPKDSIGKTKSIMIGGKAIDLTGTPRVENDCIIYKGLGINNEIEGTTGDLILRAV